MNKRKLQIFLSSTYEDLIDHRLAAMEAILAAGHIPATMEQFTPGDEEAWDKIQRWIDGSDALFLILGGRYGSIEPKSGKSYMHLEYEYALDKGKPFCSIVMTDAHLQERIKEIGFARADERVNPEKYKQFKELVLKKHCAPFNDKKDIRATIFQKVPDWAAREDLVGWIRVNEVPTTATMNELARLSQENRELRAQVSNQQERFDGLTFEEMVKVLRENRIPTDLLIMMLVPDSFKYFRNLNRNLLSESFLHRFHTSRMYHAGDVFELFHEPLSRNPIKIEGLTENTFPFSSLMDKLVSHGIVSKDDNPGRIEYKLTEVGRRFRNRMLLAGDSEGREVLWRVDSDEKPSGTS